MHHSPDGDSAMKMKYTTEYTNITTWLGPQGEQISNEVLQMFLLLLLLMAGDIESNPGPITIQEYKDMTPQQRKAVPKDDLSQLLHGIIENEEVSLTTIMTELQGIKTELIQLKNLKQTKREIGESKEEIKKQNEIIKHQQQFSEKVDGADRGKKLIVLGMLGMKEDDEVPKYRITKLLNSLQAKNDVMVSDIHRLGNRREENGYEPVIHKRPLLVTVYHVGMRNTLLNCIENCEQTKK